MDGKRLIEKIRLRNILSFGDKGEEITLEPLNIIIGQNASGKSNLVDVIKLLRSLPQDRGLVNLFSKSGGIYEWIWKGKKNAYNSEVFVQIRNINYFLQFGEANQRLAIIDESIRGTDKKAEDTLNREFSLTDFENSILSQTDGFNSDARKFLTLLRRLRIAFSRSRTYTDLQTNRSSEIRKQQPADALNDFLEEDGTNLSLVLSDLQLKGNAKETIVEYLQKFNPKIKDYLVIPSGGTVQLFIKEEGLNKPISAMRLSDGTLRYLCLLAILCHPEPPPLICIEEPETGLHPDILPTIAELMIEASQRTQLIVTTHSDILVSAFSEIPEAILVCEKDEDGTHFKRLNEEELKIWMEEYNDLGEIWLRGGIGGTRW